MTDNPAEPYQLLPPLTDEEYQALKADIAARGVLVAVERDEAGNLLDGHHRLRAVAELRAEGRTVAEPPCVVREGLSEPDKRLHVRALHTGRRSLNREQRRGIVADQLRETPELSNRRIATVAGVDHHTVAAVRARLVATGEIPQLDRTVGADGRERPATVPQTSSAPRLLADGWPMSASRQARLEEAEGRITAALGGDPADAAEFYACLGAVETVRARELYRAQWPTFDAFCRDRFGLDGELVAGMIDGMLKPTLAELVAEGRESF